ncbi:MAG: hypothetical protein JSS65_00720 [Armatimonadetes bacterium]|nr:hypothetical protein [Armatimonadota bacterium]
MERRTVRNILLVVGVLFAGFLAWRIVTGVVFAMFGALFKLVLPVAIVAGIGYVVYRQLFADRSLTGSSRGRLPRL